MIFKDKPGTHDKCLHSTDLTVQLWSIFTEIYTLEPILCQSMNSEGGQEGREMEMKGEEYKRWMSATLNSAVGQEVVDKTLRLCYDVSPASSLRSILILHGNQKNIPYAT